MQQPEFDSFSASYDSLLKDPLRDTFTGGSDFFYARKRDLIREYFSRAGKDTSQLRYLDVGCGKGDLISMLAGDFAGVAGCDPSSAMLESGNVLNRGLNARVQPDPARIPFNDKQFDFVTAVCVYHHVPPARRAALTAEVRRVLRPDGVFAIIEHNPYNPVTRLIVGRTPVDADAILLRAGQAQSLLAGAGFAIDRKQYFLYLPEKFYRLAAMVESVLRRVPLGGQYAVFGKLTGEGKLRDAG
jgi:SAM-dependent methyltransferase